MLIATFKKIAERNTLRAETSHVAGGGVTLYPNRPDVSRSGRNPANSSGIGITGIRRSTNRIIRSTIG